MPSITKNQTNPEKSHCKKNPGGAVSSRFLIIYLKSRCWGSREGPAGDAAPGLFVMAGVISTASGAVPDAAAGAVPDGAAVCSAGDATAVSAAAAPTPASIHRQIRDISNNVHNRFIIITIPA